MGKVRLKKGLKGPQLPKKREPFARPTRVEENRKIYDRNKEKRKTKRDIMSANKEVAEVKHIKEDEWMVEITDIGQIYGASVAFRNLLVDTASAMKKDKVRFKIYWRLEK